MAAGIRGKLMRRISETTSATERGIPLLDTREVSSLDPRLRSVVENRKSGLSLNHIVGCSLECSYCVRHTFGNFEMKQPKAIMSDQEAVRLLTTHPYFLPNITPIQLFNRATDPFLLQVKPHTFAVVNQLDAMGLQNHLLLITRYRVTEADAFFLKFCAAFATDLIDHSLWHR